MRRRFSTRRSSARTRPSSTKSPQRTALDAHKGVAMDQHRFDNLTRLIGSGVSRRSILRGFLGVGGGAVLSSFAVGETGAAPKCNQRGWTPCGSDCCHDKNEECCTHSSGAQYCYKPGFACCDDSHCIPELCQVCAADGSCDAGCTDAQVCCPSADHPLGYGCLDGHALVRCGIDCCDLSIEKCCDLGDGNASCIPKGACCTNDDCPDRPQFCETGACIGGNCFAISQCALPGMNVCCPGATEAEAGECCDACCPGARGGGCCPRGLRCSWDGRCVDPLCCEDGKVHCCHPGQDCQQMMADMDALCCAPPYRHFCHCDGTVGCCLDGPDCDALQECELFSGSGTCLVGDHFCQEGGFQAPSQLVCASG